MQSEIFEFFRYLAWIRFQGHNIFGIIVFLAMIIVTWIRLLKIDKIEKQKFREECIHNAILFVVSISFASFFIHVIDMTSIPSLVFLFGPVHISRINYLNDIVLQQLVISESLIVYHYRKWFDVQLFLKYIPIMALYGFATAVIFGATSARQLLGDDIVIYFTLHYIPTWIIFFISYLMLIEKPKSGGTDV